MCGSAFKKYEERRNDEIQPETFLSPGFSGNYKKRRCFPFSHQNCFFPEKTMIMRKLSSGGGDSGLAAFSRVSRKITPPDGKTLKDILKSVF